MKKRLLILACIIASAVAASPLSAQQAGTLQAISFQKEGDRIIVSIKIDGAFSYEASELAAPQRLVMDFSPIDRIIAAPFLQVDNGGITAIRSGQFKPRTARIVFDLAEKAPAHSVTAVSDGLKIAFWLEAEAAVPPAVKEPAPRPVREIPQEAVQKVVEETPPGEGRTGIFVRAGVGLTLMLKPSLSLTREFILYGETGSINETYNYKSALAFDAAIGKYFRLGGTSLKAGLGLTYWRLATEGTFDMSIPHPFLMNSPRTVSFTETEALKSNLMNFYAFGLFSFLDTGNFSIWFGPVVGLSIGKVRTLGDWDLEDKSPFASADVSLTNIVAAEDSITELLFGADLSLELSLGRKLALVLDTKMLYLNPNLSNLGHRANLLQVQPTLSLQVSF